MMKKLFRSAQALAALLLVTTWGSNVQASVIITAIESGSDVILSSVGGTLDLTGLTFDSTSNGGTTNAVIDPDALLVAVGTTDNVFDRYAGASGPAAFGSGTTQVFADSYSGDLFGVSNFTGSLWIAVPTGFTSGGTLGAASGTWLNQSFATLGMTPGTYVWSWASDSITLQVSAVPVPAAVWLFGSGLLGLIGIARRKKAA
ncbi:MAG: VPLPA-CTERM sorting domain-containing protein [Gammaproteobacteria bacterium]|nr:VPLPA-CTERM sorting domain-containing protein [Gammaproteobacteria bacterium]